MCSGEGRGGEASVAVLPWDCEGLEGQVYSGVLERGCRTCAVADMDVVVVVVVMCGGGARGDVYKSTHLPCPASAAMTAPDA